MSAGPTSTEGTATSTIVCVMTTLTELFHSWRKISDVGYSLCNDNVDGTVSQLTEVDDEHSDASAIVCVMTTLTELFHSWQKLTTNTATSAIVCVIATLTELFHSWRKISDVSYSLCNGNVDGTVSKLTEELNVYNDIQNNKELLISIELLYRTYLVQ